MASSSPRAFNYERQSIILNAPAHSGIFAIFAWNACVFVGEAADLCASLLTIYDAANPCLAHVDLTHFTVELVAAESRLERQAERIQELGPVCTLGVGSPEGRDARLALGSGPCRGSR